MSPSIEALEKQIGRPLRPGDALVSRSSETGTLTFEEVVNPSIKEDPKRVSIKNGWRGEKPAVKTRELTQIGPIINYYIRERYTNYADIIELKDRTDKSELAKLILEIRSLIRK